MHNFIQHLWSNYLEITPSVQEIKSILKLKNDHLFNDHIAFRSINTDLYGIKSMSKPFIDKGYRVMEHYTFKEKKLNAVHLENIFSKDSPKIFISELILEQCSFFLKQILLKSFYEHSFNKDAILTIGRNWKISYAIYKELEKESKYASWLYIHGIRVNHFTLNVNQLKGYSIESLCNKLKTSKLTLNKSGNIIKGSTKQGLKQASIISDKISVKFEDLYHSIKVPSCYLEFAERFAIDNNIFNGFLVKSADKIFESTYNTSND